MVIALVRDVIISVDVVNGQSVGEVPLQGHAITASIGAVETVLKRVCVVPKGITVALVIRGSNAEIISEGDVNSAR